MSANYGGTDIYKPLKEVFNTNNKTSKLRVFLLTDGSVDKPDDCIKLIKGACKLDGITKVFTFGIGSGCSKYLVDEAAKAGKGTCSLVNDNQMSELKQKVISSLQKAGDPCYIDCSLSFGVPAD